MKILVSSDIHGNVDLLAQLKQKAKDVDLVLYCGDIAKSPASAEKQKLDLDNLLAVLDEIECPCRFIRGNCDNFETQSEYYLNKEETIGGIRIIPFEDILTTPFGTFREVSEEKIAENLNKINGNNAIILAHQPPKGAGDKIALGMHVGSKSVTQWIEKEKPLYWLCGHIHEANGEYKIGETKVINASGQFIIHNL